MLALVAALAQQLFYSETVFDPSEHLSPDGALVLEVDPTVRKGDGPARYHLRRGTETVWEGELPFTLTELAVLDSGHVVGISEVREMSFLKGDLVVAVVAPDGELVLEERNASEASRFLHMPDSPVPRGLVLDPPRGRFAVRIADPDVNRGHESWWRYAISTGERREDLVPEAAMPESGRRQQHLLEARPLPGADLLLLHWWVADFADYSRGYAAEGAAFTLVREADASIVWRLDLPRDYTIDGDEAADDALEARVRAHGAILDTGPGDRFALWHVRDGERVEYSVVEDPEAEEGWRVAEAARATLAPPAPPPAPAPVEVPLLPLVSLDPVELETASDAAAELGTVVSWGFDGQGGFVAIRREEEPGAFTHLHLDSAGAIGDERPFEPFGSVERRYPRWIHDGGGRWLVVDQTYGDDRTLDLYRADAATGGVEPLPEFVAPRAGGVAFGIDVLATAPDGGFVTLGDFHFRYTTTSALFAFDADGRQRWAVGEDYQNETKLFSPESVAVTSDGLVVVLDNIRDTLQVYDADGSHLSNADLAAVWGADPNYLSHITAAPDGDLLIHDFNGHPPLFYVDPDGVPYRKLTPHFADGREPDDLPRQARFGPDGNVWTFDGYGFLRLDEDGLAVERVGAEARADAIYELGARAVLGGRICAQDQRTGALHVWDETGARLFVGAVEPEDADQVDFIAQLDETADGSVWVTTESRGRLGWDATGKRLGYSELVPPLARSADGERVVRRDGPTAVIEDAAGNLVARIERRPDRCWLRSVLDAAFLPDGTLALLHPRLSGEDGSGPLLLVYSADGAPLRQVELDAGSGQFAVSGSWIVTPGAGGVVLFDLEEERTFRFELQKSDPNTIWAHGLSADGRRVLSFDLLGLVVQRHALP